MSGKFWISIKPSKQISEVRRAELQQWVDDTCGESDILPPQPTDTQADHNLASVEGWGNQTMPRREP